MLLRAPQRPHQSQAPPQMSRPQDGSARPIPYEFGAAGRGRTGTRRLHFRPTPGVRLLDRHPLRPIRDIPNESRTLCRPRSPNPSPARTPLDECPIFRASAQECSHSFRRNDSRYAHRHFVFLRRRLVCEKCASCARFVFELSSEHHNARVVSYRTFLHIIEY